MISQKDSHQFLDDLERDLNEGGSLRCVGITLSDNDKRVILTLSNKYVTAFTCKQDIEQRFDDGLNIFLVFMSSISSPCQTEAVHNLSTMGWFL